MSQKKVQGGGAEGLSHQTKAQSEEEKEETTEGEVKQEVQNWFFCHRCKHKVNASRKAFRLDGLGAKTWCNNCSKSWLVKTWSCACGKRWFECETHQEKAGEEPLKPRPQPEVKRRRRRRRRRRKAKRPEADDLEGLFPLGLVARR